LISRSQFRYFSPVIKRNVTFASTEVALLHRKLLLKLRVWLPWEPAATSFVDMRAVADPGAITRRATSMAYSVDSFEA
jgi:hypothetical protein